ncbi:hypothetical protein K458DRAFT_257806, partial [Lentithecium fluviatile CBS 122367]
MELLDLPPEIIDRILSHHVNKVGTFKTCITHNILAKQPINAFLKIHPNNGRRILRKNLSTYLKYRIKKLNGAHPFLPNFIKHALDRLEKVSGPVDFSTKTKNEGTLCDVLVKESEEIAFELVTTDVKRKKCQRHLWMFDHTQTDDADYAIAAAAAIGDMGAMVSFIKPDPTDIWLYSPAFGYPLAIAAYTGEYLMVKRMLDAFKIIGLMRDPKSFEEMYEQAILFSLQSRHVAVTMLLTENHPLYFAAVEKKAFQSWLKEAIDSGNSELVDAVLKLNHNGGVDCYAQGFNTACKLGHANMVRLFFEPGRLGINQHTKSAAESSGCSEITFPLSIAVCSGHLSVVKEMLRLGANASGPRLKRH